MTSSPIIRRAYAILPGMLKSGPKDPDGVAGASAKRMMGAANPIAANPEGGSTMCVTCNRWHRPGSMCTKAMSLDALIQKGRRVAVYHGMTPGNSFRDPADGSFAGATKTGSAASEVSLEGLKHAVTEHNYSQPESWAPPLPQTVPALEQQHSQNQQPAQQAQQAPAPVPPPVPFAINGIHNLLTYQPDPSKPQEGSKKLADNSAQLQNQQAGYLTALRNWQSMYGAAQPAPTGMAV